MGQHMSEALLDAIDRIALTHGDRAARELAEAGQWPAELWKDLQGLGLAQACLQEKDGGVELPLADLLPLLGRIAYHALPVPIAETALALALARQADCLPSEPLRNQPLSLGLVDVNDRLQGLAFGPICQAALVSIGQGESASLAWLPQPCVQAGFIPRRNLAGEPCCDLQLSATLLDSLDQLKLPHADRWLMQAAALMRSVQMSHAMSKALQLSLQFANERVQFGKPIGKFQAVQHMLAVMASEVAAASAIVGSAVDAFAAARWPDPVDADHGDWWVGAAKARCGEAAAKVFEIAHQVHAAMGYTREHRLHFTTRRLLVWRDGFGAEHYWQARLGHQAIKFGADRLWPKLAEA